MDFGSFQTKKREELSIHRNLPTALNEDTTRLPDLRFDRLQIPEKDLVCENKLEFGQFVAREALIDEEYWLNVMLKQQLCGLFVFPQAAAWLRAESNWEGRTNERHTDIQKRSYAEQEFHAIRRRLLGPYGQKSKCMITVRKQEGQVKRTVLKSVVGTLDLSIRCLLPGESFPGEHGISPQFCNMEGGGKNSYSYVANLVVSKSARRQGIASNMMQFAIETASSSGVKHLYIHVDRSNKLAQKLYEKIGFKIMEEASIQLEEHNTYLLRCIL
ncbi:hypothetical protein LINPERHAP2_LOCUS16174 [Linum perenne]